MTKVLLVEDDNNLREIYEARLAAEGYEISSAQDGEEALEVAKKVQPDLIISDVMMPRISGFEMLDILRNTHGLQRTKVIMLTALGQDEDKTRADSLGADRYLVKSQVTLEDIVKAAQELLSDESPAAQPDATATAETDKELSPIAPPAMAAAAHAVTETAPAEPQQQPLSSYENTAMQPPAQAATPPVQPTIDPIAQNDQALQAAAAALSMDAPVEPAVNPVTTETPAPVSPEVAPPAPAPEQPAVVPQPVVADPVAQPAPATPVVPTPSMQSITPPPAPTPVAVAPEAAVYQAPSIPEIERAMEAPAPAPIPSAPIAAPEIAQLTEPIQTPAQPQPTTETLPATAPEITSVQTPPADSPLERPVITATPPAPVESPVVPAVPEPPLPDMQSVAQEASVVNNQIDNFMPDVPEASAVPEPTAPAAAEPAPTPPAPTPVQSEPAAQAEAPSQLPSAPIGSSSQRVIQPITPTEQPVDIHELAAREGQVIDQPAPAFNGQTAVFTPNVGGNAQDAAL